MGSKTTKQAWIQFHDKSADSEGRRRFSLFWLGEGSLPGTSSTFSFRGTRRAQEFFCDPTRFAYATEVTCAPWECGTCGEELQRDGHCSLCDVGDVGGMYEAEGAVG